MFTKARITLLAFAMIFAVGTLSAQIGYREAQTVTGTQISELDRRIANLEENRIDSRLVRIETMLQESAKASEATRQTMLAVLVPVTLLTLEALFRLGAALPLKKKQ